MDKYLKREQSDRQEILPDKDLLSIENPTTIPVKIPDLLDLSRMDFKEAELRSFLRLRNRYKKADSEITEEAIRLNFARFLFEQGKISI